jgi:hypothetical protein
LLLLTVLGKSSILKTTLGSFCFKARKSMPDIIKHEIQHYFGKRFGELFGQLSIDPHQTKMVGFGLQVLGATRCF